MNDKNSLSYTCGTSSRDYRHWGWYIEYADLLFLVKQGERVEFVESYEGGKLPLKLGIEFSTWVMGTPELRDIVFRRFVQGDYENKLEGKLLTDAVEFYSLSRGIKGGLGYLPVCWLQIAKIINGEIPSVDSEQFGEELLKSSFAFVNE